MDRPLLAVRPLADAELEDRLKRLVGIERRALTLLLAHLCEFDRRRLHADRGHPSLFSYCTQVLKYSEQAAYKRIQAARAAREHPEILQCLMSGEITLTAVVILSPHFRADNVTGLLAAARGKRTREIEVLAAGLAPRPDSQDCLRALPVPPGPIETAKVDSPNGCSAPEQPPPTPSPQPRDVIEPLSARRYLFRFTGSLTMLAKYERIRALRATKSMEATFEAALDTFLERAAPERRISRRKARSAADHKTECVSRRASRRISAALRDAVWERDGGRCTFTGPSGDRCSATAFLETDHVRPYALGGRSDDAANLRLMCRTHNQLLARRVFGRKADYP